MPDIVTSQVFSDGEKGITATKLNNIIANSVIQPDFVTAKPSSSTLDPTDQLLEVKGAGTYARITGQQLIDSVSASVTQNITPTIWSVRLRSLNCAGNPTYEVDQINIGGSVPFISVARSLVDRWIGRNVGSTMTATGGRQNASGAELVVPGTNFAISRNFLRVTLTAAQASLAATDYLTFYQTIEGPRFRELQYDVHSCSLLVRSSVSGLKFGLSIGDAAGTRSLLKLCTIPSANTWVLLTYPNLPIFPSAGNFSSAPGVAGYLLSITLAAGSTYTAPANDTWQNGSFIGALGQDNFASKPVNSTVDFAFMQHEPGSQCTTPIDCSFGQNYDGDFGCLRYSAKSYPYATKAGTVLATGCSTALPGSTSFPLAGVRWPKIMAKTPTTTLYSPNNGAVNTVFNYISGSNIAASTSDVNETGMTTLSTPSGLSAGQGVIFHWVSDTGW
jgi:hypothetical protein